jgi:hypothetical protein
MDAKEVRKLAKELKDLSKRLYWYKEQLEARHKDDPLKSPPVFLLNTTALDLEFKAKRLLSSLKK